MSFVKNEQIKLLVTARNLGDFNQEDFFKKYGYTYCGFRLAKPRYRPVKDWYCMKIARPGQKTCWTHAYTVYIIDLLLSEFLPIHELRKIVLDFVIG